MDHIWTIENWEQNIDFMEEGHRTGIWYMGHSGVWKMIIQWNRISGLRQETI